MEYVDGQPITQYCDEHKLDIDARLELFDQVLDAVQFAHASLVIHRDLKPSNILVTAQGDVRLLDFGIAKLLADNDTAQETQLTQMAGRALTPDYASPEQIKGEPLTIATDIYSLGVVLFELLVGSRPYRLKVRSAAQLEQAIVDAQPQHPSSAATPEAATTRSTNQTRLTRALAGDLDTVLLKTLAKLPAERYLTVAEFAQDLRNHAAGLPVRAQPASWRYRASKFVLRNRLAVGAASTIGLVLIVATGVSLWQARLAMQQTTVAQREAKRAHAVQTFLLDLFRANTDAQPDPLRARETTARELLDIGAVRVSNQLSDVPEVQDEVLATLSDMFRSLGLANRETEMEQQRLEVRRKLYGPNDPRVAEVLIHLAYTMRTTSDMQQAPALLAEAKGIVDRNPQTSPLVRAKLLTELARAEMYSDVTRMRRYAHEAAGHLQKIETSPEHLSEALRFEAVANAFLGRWNVAMPMQERALAEARKNDFRPFNSALTTTVELADTHAWRGDVPAAERIYREILAESMRRNGELHVDTVHVEARLVGFLHATSRGKEARALRDSILNKLARSEGKTDVGLAGMITRNAAISLFTEGQFAQAAPLITEASDQARRFLPNSIVLAARLLPQGQLLTETGRYAEAGPVLDEAASVVKAAMGADAHPVITLRFQQARARLLITSRRADRAIEMLRPLVSAPVPDGVVLAIDHLRAQNMLASAYVAAGELSGAIETAQAVLNQLQRSTVGDYFQSIEADARLQLGRAQARAGYPRAARVNLERSLSLRIANQHPSSPWVAEGQIALAECVAALGDQVQAKSLLKRAATILSSHTELGEHFKQPLTDAQQRLGMASDARGAQYFAKRNYKTASALR